MNSEEELQSSRLIYCKVNHNSFEDYSKWYSDDMVMRYISGRGLNPAEVNDRFQSVLELNALHTDFGFYLVKKKDDMSFLGIAKLVKAEEDKAEVGYGSMPQYWGMGYASEMLDFLIRKAKSHKEIHELIAITSPHNHASIRVLVKRHFIEYDQKMTDQTPEVHYKLSL